MEELSNDEWALRQACFDRFETLPLKDYFSELKSVTKKPIVGNVLAFYLGRLFARIDDIQKRQFAIVNVIRHPVTRLTSTLKTWTSNENDFIPSFIELDFNTRCGHLKNFILKSHKMDFSNKDKAFLVSLLAMEDIAKDVSLATSYDIPNVKYEDITTNKESFRQLVDTITKGRVELSTDFLDTLHASKKINAHNNTGINTANQQYQSWEQWQQDAFKFTMERIDMIKVYNGLNYDFSFIK